MEQRSQAESAMAGVAYGMLFVLGVVMGVVGGFTHGGELWPAGPIPVTAIIWLFVLFGICLAAGKMMRSRLGAGVTALGWLLVSMAFSFELGAGDLVISGNAAGYVYLYGGIFALVAAICLAPSSGRSWLLHGHPEGGGL